MTPATQGPEQYAELVKRLELGVYKPSRFDVGGDDDWDIPSANAAMDAAMAAIEKLIADNATLEARAVNAEQEVERLRHEVESAGALRLRMEAHKQSADAARQNFHTMQLAANELRKERDAARTALVAAWNSFAGHVVDEFEDIHAIAQMADGDLPSQIESLTTQRDAAEARVAKLEEALRPFAEAADIKLCGEWRDDERFAQTDVGFYLTFGHLRTARSTLTSKAP